MLLAWGRVAAQQRLFFPEVYVWEYRNEHIPSGEPGHAGEVAVYHNPKTNYWLFTAEAYGGSGEMVNWVVGKPDGTYIIQYSMEHGAPVQVRQKIAFSQHATFPKHYVKSGKAKLFGDTSKGFAAIPGQPYAVRYTATLDQSILFMARVQAITQALNNFNRLDCEAKLPIYFPQDVPPNTLLLADESVSGAGVKISYAFKYISHTYYEVVVK